MSPRVVWPIDKLYKINSKIEELTLYVIEITEELAVWNVQAIKYQPISIFNVSAFTTFDTSNCSYPNYKNRRVITCAKMTVKILDGGII